MKREAASRHSRFLGLRGVGLFEGLDAFSLEEIGRRCALHWFRRRERVIARDGTDRDVYFVISGTVRAAAPPARGRALIFRDLPAGEVFGELAALDRRARSADVVAVTDCMLASLTPERFHEVLALYPSVRLRLFQRLARSVRELSERLVELSTLDVEHRIGMELLRLARDSGVTRNAARIHPAPTHRELASRVATYREQVTRSLSAFARRGLIAREGRALVVRDVPALERTLAERRRPAPRTG